MTGPPGVPGRLAVLRDYPLRLWAEQSEYFEGLLREYKLLLLDEAAHLGSDAPPSQLVELATTLDERFGPVLLAVNGERQAASDRGLDRIDSHVPLVDGTPAVMNSVRRILERSDDFCRDRQLLALPRSPELLAFGTWAGEEILAQYGGAAPTPWPGPF